MGFGDNSLKIISKIIRNNDHFTSLDLRKNYITGGEGLSNLAKSLLYNKRIVHLDLGCNSITSEAAEELFTLLINQ
jgi:Leucine-rich repeat (LRR) protein